MSTKWNSSDAEQSSARSGFRSNEHASAASETQPRQIVYHFKHRVSCHRCGNMRKSRRECVRCPHVYCHQCEGKMVEQFGENIFKDGCPVCKELCCCGKNRSFTCPHVHHCYKKCPSTKRHSYKTATGFATASKRCMKSQLLLREIAAGHAVALHSDSDHPSSDHSRHVSPGSSRGRNENVRRSARISQLYAGNHKPVGSYAEIEDSQSDLSDHEHEREHVDGHTSEGETSCAGSDSGDHSSHEYDDHHHDHKRTSSAALVKDPEVQPVKAMRPNPQQQFAFTTPNFSTMMPTAPVTAMPLQQQLVPQPIPMQQQMQMQQQLQPSQAQPQQYDWSCMLDIDMRGLLENFGDFDDDWLNLDEAELQTIF